MKEAFFHFVLLVFILGIPSSVYPCSCANPSQREKFRKADYVFLGEVTEIADSNLHDFAYAVKFKVERQWKGSHIADAIVHFTYDTPGMCGDLHLAKGKRFLIYAYRTGVNVVSYTDCGPNLEAKYASASIRKLDSVMYRFFARVYPL